LHVLLHFLSRSHLSVGQGVFLSVVSESFPTVNTKGQVVVDKAFSLVSGPVYGPVIFLLSAFLSE
jgi:hypothetical protein